MIGIPVVRFSHYPRLISMRKALVYELTRKKGVFMKSIVRITLIPAFILLFGSGVALEATAIVVQAGDNVYIEDRTGERWDITQAASIGFKPRGFQFGIGRDSIRPLDASSLDDNVVAVDSQARVIGVNKGPDAHAYVVRKLTRHEIANTQLGEVPIAAAY